MTGCRHLNLNEDNALTVLVYEFLMNYPKDSFRNAYVEAEKQKTSKVTADTLRELGFSEEEIAKEDL